MAARPLSDADGLVDRLHLIAIHLLRLLRGQEDAAGVSGPRLSALRVIAEHGPLSVGDLAARERVRSPTMVDTVKELERRHLVVKERDLIDKRVTLVRATEAGLLELADDRDRVRRALEGALGGLGHPEVESLNGCVETLYRALARGDS